jgi:hypothetical protein
MKSASQITAEHRLSEPKTVANMELDFSFLLTAFYSDLYAQISLADSKAQLIMGANAVLLAALVVDIASVGQLLQGDSFLGKIGGLLIMATAFMLATSIYFGIVATLPKMGQSKHDNNLFFFGHITQMKQQDYLREFLQLSPMQIKVSYITEIHARAHIAEKKFEQVRWGLIILTSGFCLWVCAHILLAFIQ